MTGMSREALTQALDLPRAAYAWVITRDIIDDGKNNGQLGPSNCALTADEIQQHPNADEFRVLDDDGEVYWYGYFVDLASVNDDVQPDGFEPLDDYGRSYGCTEIHYKCKDGGKWEQL